MSDGFVENFWKPVALVLCLAGCSDTPPPKNPAFGACIERQPIKNARGGDEPDLTVLSEPNPFFIGDNLQRIITFDFSEKEIWYNYGEERRVIPFSDSKPEFNPDTGEEFLPNPFAKSLRNALTACQRLWKEPAP